MESLQVTLTIFLALVFAVVSALCAVGIRMQREIDKASKEMLDRTKQTQAKAEAAAAGLVDAHNSVMLAHHDLANKVSDLKMQFDLSKSNAIRRQG